MSPLKLSSHITEFIPIFFPEIPTEIILYLYDINFCPFTGPNCLFTLDSTQAIAKKQVSKRTRTFLV